MSRTDLSPDVLRKLIDYDPSAGTMVWREREPSDFTATPGRTAQHQCALWNSNFSGRAVFSTAGPDGYLRSRVKGTTYVAHRVAWAIHFGEWPKGMLDHINGIRCDIRIANLREVTPADNTRNACVRRDNKSGVPGVYFRKSTGRWLVTIGQKHVGAYRSFEDAVAAKKAAERAHNYHPNHGRKHDIDAAIEALSALKARCITIRKDRAA